jgi:choline-phosphate cytidylyltransferase
VRDYEKYIARQFKRGTSRQELNVSWLKKNELDLKRHVSEIRDSIRTNWTTTGQELGKELQKFWQNSRPASPMRSQSALDVRGEAGARGDRDFERGLTSPSALSHIRERLEIPGQGNNGGDFATGYSLGLIGGVRSWVRLFTLLSSPLFSHSSSLFHQSLSNVEIDKARWKHGKEAQRDTSQD